MFKDKDVTVIVLEFILSIIVLLIGGFLVYSGKGTELGVAMVTAVITFWFQRRQSESAQRQVELYRQQQEQQQTAAQKTGKGDDGQ